MTDRELSALAQLLGAYLHQDWPDEFDSDVSALRAIVDSEPRETILAAMREIDDLLSASLPESEVRGLIAGPVGCYFDPTSEGMTYKQWLMRVQGVFAKE